MEVGDALGRAMAELLQDEIRIMLACLIVWGKQQPLRAASGNRSPPEGGAGEDQGRRELQSYRAGAAERIALP